MKVLETVLLIFVVVVILLQLETLHGGIETIETYFPFLDDTYGNTTKSSPTNQDDYYRITYELTPNGTFNRSFVQNYICDLGADCNVGCPPRWKVPSSMNIPRAFDFNTTLSTNLNILMMGDSVAIQMAQALEGSLGVNYPKTRDMNDTHRQIMRIDWGTTNEGVTLSKVRGGGSLATFRINGWFLKDREGAFEYGNLPPLNGAGGWRQQDVNDLLNHPNLIGGHFDVMFYRVPFGWIKTEFLDDIDSIKETILLGREHFGVTAVVLITVPFCNNVQTPHDMKVVEEINEKMRRMSLNWEEEMGLKHVLVMDLSKLIKELMEDNAKEMGYDIKNETYWMDRATFPQQAHLSVPHACGSPELNPDRQQCIRNFYSRDGMHFCMEGIGSRLIAGQACILACVFNDTNGSRNKSRSEIQECTTRCNDQYMSIKPIEQNMFDANQL